MSESWNLMQYFEMGGIFMWPLLLFSILTMAIFLERLIYLSIHDLNPNKIRQHLLDLSRSKRINEANLYLSQLNSRNISGIILTEVFNNAPFGEHRMEKAAEAEGQEQVRKLENGFNFLSALTSIAPLTGFLGTVSGMIGAFRSIAEAADVNAQLVANGIYEALMTTVFGLIIAIVALVGYNLLIHRVDTFTAEINKLSSDIIGILSTHED